MAALLPPAAAAAALNTLVPPIPISHGNPNTHPNEFKRSYNNGNPPVPKITKDMVIATLEGMLQQSDTILNMFNVLVFINPTTLIPVVFDMFHYAQMVFFFDVILSHLKDTTLHPPGQYGHASVHYSFRVLFYDWKDEFGEVYSPCYRRDAFDAIFRKFLNLIDLPMCALRVVPEPKGTLIFHGRIVRNGIPGALLKAPIKIDEEYACRLVGLEVHPYTDTLDFVPEPNHGVNYLLLNEKNCTTSAMVSRDFHINNNLLMMSGSGFPDTISRASAKYLSLYFNMDFHGLCDNNPSGVHLLNAYNYVDRPTLPHSMFRTQVRWLGCNPFFMNCFNGLVYNNAHTYSVRDVDIINYLLDPNREFCDNITLAGNKRISYLNRMLADNQKKDLSKLNVVMLDLIIMHFLSHNLSA